MAESLFDVIFNVSSLRNLMSREVKNIITHLYLFSMSRGSEYNSEKLFVWRVSLSNISFLLKGYLFLLLSSTEISLDGTRKVCLMCFVYVGNVVQSLSLCNKNIFVI